MTLNIIFYHGIIKTYFIWTYNCFNSNWSQDDSYTCSNRKEWIEDFFFDGSFKVNIITEKLWIEDFFFDGGFKVNIITKKLWMQLKLTKSKLAPYNSHMIDKTIVRPLGLIKDLKKKSINFFIQSPLLLYRIVYWSLTTPYC